MGLESLRPHVDEVLIAADSRVEETTLAEYGALADRLFTIEYAQLERHLPWLCAQCRGDWILRLDGDELLSQALLRRLPDLLMSKRVRQFWIRRAWVYPDAARTLDQLPWSEDFAARLIRNDGSLRISGEINSQPGPACPREYVEEPLYHLALLTCDLGQREDKAVRYEGARPGLIAPGGGRLNEAFHLPELRDTLERAPTPEEDRAAIARALAGSRPDRHAVSSGPAGSPGARPRVTNVSLAEMDRHWRGRAVTPGAYKARIEPRGPHLSLTPSERRDVCFRVHNDGDERWPAGLDERPPIRLSYHWFERDGSLHAEGPRSAFPREVAPGESLLVPLCVEGPAEQGEYVLEVDLVHEHVRWFGCAHRTHVRVVAQDELPAAAPRLQETAALRFRRWRRTRIPPTIHRVWLGGGPMPTEQQRFGESFARLHPGWEMRLWSERDLPELDIGAEERERSRSHSELSNLVRYEILRRYGGLYVDTDVECRQTLTPLLRGIDAFAALETPGTVGSAILGSVADHRVFTRAARLARTTLGEGPNSPAASGPQFLSRVIEQEQDMAIFPARLFYPYLWYEPERRHEHFPEAYAVHHWAKSWVPDDDR